MMSNHEWVELIAKEFNCSNSMARSMFHSMLVTRKMLAVSKDVRRGKAEQEQKEELQMQAWEESDKEAYDCLFEKE